MKEQTVNPYEMDLLDLWNEVGGQMIIKFYKATLRPQKELLQRLHDHGIKAGLCECLFVIFASNGYSEDDLSAFMQEADEAGASASVTFEAAEGEALNIKSKEENPMVDQLVEAIENQ